MNDRKRKEKPQDFEAKRLKSHEKFYESDLLITEEDLESKPKRRGAVKDDVYESDDQVQDSDISEQEEEADIFQEKNEIEGQEWGQVEDTDKFVPFNLDRELEEGEFDAQGNYILKKKDEMDIHDSWLHGTTKTDMERAKKAHDLLEARLKAADALQSHSQEDSIMLWRQLLEYMHQGESVVKTIARMGKEAKKQSKESKKNGKPAKKAGSSSPAIDHLTGICTKLFDVDVNVYEKTYEEIFKIVGPQSEKPGSNNARNMLGKEQTGESLWEYKWGSGSEEIFGPFPSSSMQQWAAQGFFTSGEAYIRKLNRSSSLDAATGFQRYDPKSIKF